MKSRTDYENFLIWDRFKLAPGWQAADDALHACVRTAYGDLKRTIHGIGHLQEPQKSAIKDEAHIKILNFLRSIKSANNLGDFDQKHRDACTSLKKHFSRNELNYFSIGQSQKWINMSVKYLFVICNTFRIEYEHIYNFCHIPIDGYILGILPKDITKHVEPWSKISSYEKYFDFQNWFRNQYSCPLDAEFDMWLKASQERQQPSAISPVFEGDA